MPTRVGQVVSHFQSFLFTISNHTFAWHQGLSCFQQSIQSPVQYETKETGSHRNAVSSPLVKLEDECHLLGEYVALRVTPAEYPERPNRPILLGHGKSCVMYLCYRRTSKSFAGMVDVIQVLEFFYYYSLLLAWCSKKFYQY